MDNTFFQDFTIADQFGVSAIKDTYNRAFKEWHNDYEMLTGLVMALNHKIWQHYEAKNQEYAELYNELWETTDNYAVTHLKGKALQYFYEVTD